MSNPYKFRRKVILLKPEATYGVDSVPTGAANAILGLDVSFDPNLQTPLERPLVKPTLGNVVKPIADRHVSLQFDVEAAGSGTSGAGITAAKYGPALRAAGLAETVITTVGQERVEYKPVGEGEESASAYFNMDGVLHKMLGCRGNVEFVATRSQVPVFRFSLLGLHADPAATALPIADFSGFQKPRPISQANTPTFTLDGFAARLQSLTINLGQAVAYRPLVNAESVAITGRNPAGQVTIEAPQIGTKDFFAVAKAETLVVLQLVHGTVAGNTVQVDAPKVQLVNPRYVDIDGIAHLQMDLNVAENAGDDEVVFTTK